MRVTSKEDLTDEASLHNTEAKKIMCGARFDIHNFVCCVGRKTQNVTSYLLTIHLSEDNIYQIST